MFQTNEGPSFPAHQYLAFGHVASLDYEYHLGGRKPGRQWQRCGVPSASRFTNNTLDISNPSPETTEGVVNFPLCFEHPTLTDVLDAASLSWKYYAPVPGSIWTAPDAIEHMCQPYSADGKYDDTVCNGPDWTNAEPKVVIEGRMHRSSTISMAEHLLP